MNLNEISSFLDLKYPNNLGFFVFGSHVYGTCSDQSDIDLVVIDDSRNGQTEHNKYDIQFISMNLLIDQIKNCEIKALECYFTDQKILKSPLIVDIDWVKLRSSISQKSSHSWVKSKKKIIDKEFYIAKKSLFHSLRIINFGSQLAQFKKIKDFSQVNGLWYKILIMNNEELIKYHQPIYNQMHSEFKKLCPLKK